MFFEPKSYRSKKLATKYTGRPRIRITCPKWVSVTWKYSIGVVYIYNCLWGSSTIFMVWHRVSQVNCYCCPKTQCLLILEETKKCKSKPKPKFVVRFKVHKPKVFMTRPDPILYLWSPYSVIFTRFTTVLRLCTVFPLFLYNLPFCFLSSQRNFRHILRTTSSFLKKTRCIYLKLLQFFGKQSPNVV